MSFKLDQSFHRLLYFHNYRLKLRWAQYSYFAVYLANICNNTHAYAFATRLARTFFSFYWNIICNLCRSCSNIIAKPLIPSRPKSCEIKRNRDGDRESFSQKKTKSLKRKM